MTHLIVGLTLLALGAWGMIAWWGDFGEFLRGLIPLLLVLVGLVGIGAGLRKTVADAEHEDDEAHAPAAERRAYPEEDRLAG